MSARDPDKLRQKLRDFASDFPFFRLIGFELIDLGPRWATGRIGYRAEVTNPNGVMHGGVLSTLIDICITQAMLMTDEYQVVRDTKGSMTSIDLRVKFLRPLTSGHATCRADITHLGKRIGHAKAVVENDDGKEVALGDSIVIISEGKAG